MPNAPLLPPDTGFFDTRPRAPVDTRTTAQKLQAAFSARFAPALNAERARLQVRLLSPAQKIRRMAETMLARQAANGSCDREHLQAAGFTAAEIAAHRDEAASLAAAKAGDMVAS